MTLTDRIVAVLDALGIARAHVATQLAGDIAGLVALQSDRLAGVALVAPTRIDPAPFAGLGGRLLYIKPEGGMLSRTAASALPQLPEAQTVTLEKYAAEG